MFCHKQSKKSTDSPKKIECKFTDLCLSDESKVSVCVGKLIAVVLGLQLKKIFFSSVE